MALAYDASSAGFASATTSLSFAHTSTGVNLILVAGISLLSSTSDLISSVKYNNVAMTLIGSATSATLGEREYLYYLLAPTAGSNNIDILWDGTNQTVRGFGLSYAGAKQSGQPDSFGSNSNTTATSLAISTTVVGSGCWLTGIGGGSAGTLAAGAGTTIRQNPADSRLSMDSNGTVGTGAQTLNLTMASGNNMGIIASIAPFRATGFFNFL